MRNGWFLVDKLGEIGLDDWEVKIVDFVPSMAKPATRQVFCWGKMRKRFLTATALSWTLGEIGHFFGALRKTGNMGYVKSGWYGNIGSLRDCLLQ